MSSLFLSCLFGTHPLGSPGGIPCWGCLASPAQSPTVISTTFRVKATGGPGVTRPPPVTSIFYAPLPTLIFQPQTLLVAS